MQLIKLNKAVLSIQNNPSQFLNGLTSNSLDQPQNAFLNIHGRIIIVFDQIQINENEFWIVCETPFIKEFLNHIDKYLQLSQTQVEPLQKHVYFDLKNNHEPPSDDLKFIDQNKGRIIISDQELKTNVTDEEFRLFRIKNHIPVQGIDYTDEFVLNISDKAFVSFDKGCFLGQEPVSKVHNRSRPTWQLVVKYEDQCDEDSKAKMTSKVLDPSNNRVIGFVFINNK